MTTYTPTTDVLPSDRLSIGFRLVRQEPSVPAGAPTVLQQTTIVSTTRIEDATNSLLLNGIVFTDASMILDPIDNGVRATIITIINGKQVKTIAEANGNETVVALVLPHQVISPATASSIGTLGKINVRRVIGFIDLMGRQLTAAQVGEALTLGSPIDVNFRPINVIVYTSSTSFFSVRLTSLDFIFRVDDIDSALIYLQASTDK